jgi:N-acyl homoserine lactone hydrolase
MNELGRVESVCILDGGVAQVSDGSVYSPGFNIGVPMSLSCNAYLIRHSAGLLLWDTGTSDDMAAEPNGRIVAHGIRGVVRKTMASQFAELGIDPNDVAHLGLSHAHYDHVGNRRLFPNARWIAQRAEYEAMFGRDPEQFGYVTDLYESLRNNPTEIVAGDHDVFGDGAVRLISTPGHTLGHCSLLICLPDTGPVILSGDVAHNRENFRLRRVPAFNADKGATVTSIEKIDALLDRGNAALWINHDTEQSASLAHAPKWIT